LIAHHANLRVKEGIGGGAAIKQSVAIPGLVPGGAVGDYAVTPKG
jgi:hypothetical protein